MGFSLTSNVIISLLRPRILQGRENPALGETSGVSVDFSSYLKRKTRHRCGNDGHRIHSLCPDNGKMRRRTAHCLNATAADAQIQSWRSLHKVRPVLESGSSDFCF
jgi:hypothetical protein